MRQPVTPRAARETIRGAVPRATYEQYASRIHEPVNVLHWLDTLGSLDRAVTVQSLPRTTPRYVATALVDFIDDDAPYVNPEDLTEMHCALCGVGMYEYIHSGMHGKEYVFVTECEGVHSDGVKFIGDLSGEQRYWQADPDGSTVMCKGCARDGVSGRKHRDRNGRNPPSSLRGFHPHGSMTQYGTCGENGSVVVREWKINKRVGGSLTTDESVSAEHVSWRDGYSIVPGLNVREFLQAYALDGFNRLQTYLNTHDWVVLDRDDIIAGTQRHDVSLRDEQVLHSQQYGLSDDERAVKSLLAEWGDALKPHFEFRYLINRGKQVIVPKEYETYVIASAAQEINGD